MRGLQADPNHFTRAASDPIRLATSRVHRLVPLGSEITGVACKDRSQPCPPQSTNLCETLLLDDILFKRPQNHYEAQAEAQPVRFMLCSVLHYGVAMVCQNSLFRSAFWFWFLIIHRSYQFNRYILQAFIK